MNFEKVHFLFYKVKAFVILKGIMNLEVVS